MTNRDMSDQTEDVPADADPRSKDQEGRDQEGGDLEGVVDSNDTGTPADANADAPGAGEDVPAESLSEDDAEPLPEDYNEGVDDIVDEYDTYGGDVEPLEVAVDEDEEVEESEYRWYILKVQSNRENSICDALIRRVKVAGLEKQFGEIIVPTEDVAEYKNGKRRIVKRKLYPGYIVVHMMLTEESWFVVRETPGIGDFTGAAGKPTPMLPEEVERIVKAAHPEEDGAETVKTAIPFKLGDRVRIKEGTFENFEGDVEGIDEANGRVTVMINIFGRSTPVELEHWQIESV